MSITVMGLGSFRFGVENANFNSVSRKTDADWASVRLLNRPISHQFTGPGEDKLTIAGVLFAHWTGGLEQLSGMRVAMKCGNVMMMVSSDGDVMGRWFISSLSDTRTHYGSSGRPKKIEFQLELTADSNSFSGLRSLI